MAKINLPKEILDKESFKILPAKEKEEYFKNLLKRILELNPNGVTISQIKEATDLTYSTVWHHLEVLSCTAQGHKVSHGNIDVYYPPGKTTNLGKYKYGETHYTLSMVEDREGKVVCIHEIRQNRLGNHTVCRGMSIPVELIGDFIKTLNKAK